jgi:CO/xanthine dehydrogenase FAD-binding subunit
MKPRLFGYCAPRTLKEALALLAEDPSAMVLAGGQSLIPAINMRFAAPGCLVDIQHVAGLKGIHIDHDQIVVKAMTRHRELELNEAVRRANPLIQETMAHVAHVPIRNRGTVVGSICHADAAAEMPMLLVLTAGTLLIEGPRGRREVAAEDFFKFHMTTSREPDEIVVEARFPVLPEGAGWAFEEFTRRKGDYAIAAVGAIVEPKAGGAKVSLAACGISSRPLRLAAAEAALGDGDLSAERIEKAASAAKDAVTLPDDMHATSAYRRHLLGTLVRRALEKALSRAKWESK